MKFWFAEGKLDGNAAEYSIYDSVGHDDLLEEIASRNQLDKTEVLSNGLRLFFAFTRDGVVISGVRAIDNEMIDSDPAGYAKIIRKVMK
ncbi:MAG TPA: hypothetical protein DCO79_13240 [Spirochaeta sp.]|nr:hypothetical protein [Spirochaeta sp.]